MKNKKNILNKTNGLDVFALILVAGLGILVSAACNNPLVGLGPRVDLNPPDGEVTGAIGNGDYVRGIITLSGTITDDKEPNAVWAEVIGQRVDGTLNGDGTWDIVIDTTDTATFGSDGPKDVIVVLEDATDRTNEKELLLYFDNTAPVLMVTAPDLSDEQGELTFSIQGSAYDPYFVETVVATAGTNTDDVSVMQGNSSSWLFNVTHSIDNGDCGIQVIATDRAGNTSEAIFYSEDLKTLNGGDSVTIVDLYNLVQGLQPATVTGGLTTAHVAPTVTAGDILVALPSGNDIPLMSYLVDDLGTPDISDDVRSSGVSVAVNMDLDKPVLSLDNIGDGDVKKLPFSILGEATDDDAVDNSSFRIRFLQADGVTALVDHPAYSVWTDVDAVSPTGTVKRTKFSHDIPGDIVDGDYTFEVEVQDDHGVRQSIGPVGFRLNSNLPGLTVQTIQKGIAAAEAYDPLESYYIKDESLTISGIATDTEPLYIEVQINNGPITVVDPSLDPSVDNTWSHTITDWSAYGNFTTLTVKVFAKEVSTDEGVDEPLFLTLDKLAPVINISPAEGTVINGKEDIQVTIIGEATLDTVTRQVGLLESPFTVSDTIHENWSHSIITTNYQSDTASIEIFPADAGTGFPGVWDLPIEIVATDKAGNQTTEVRTLRIDNAGDLPELDFLTPDQDSLLGGEVMIRGLALDDDGAVNTVEVQFDFDTPDGGTPDFGTLLDSTYNLTEGVLLNGTDAETSITETTVYTLDVVNDQWSLSLNGDDDLYSTGGSHVGDIHLKVWAVDPVWELTGTGTKITSEPQILHFTLDQTRPRIEDVTVNGSAYAGDINVWGDVDLQVTASDDSNIEKVEISYMGEAFSDLWTGTQSTVSPSVTIDTTGTYGSFSGGNGFLYVTVRATDDNTPPNITEELITLYVDNTDPTAPGYDGDTTDLSGLITLTGRARDSGTIRGIDRVEVFLERGNQAYNPKRTTEYPYNATYKDAGEFTVAPTSVGNGKLTNAPYPDNVLSLIVIDRDESDTGTDEDGDGYLEELRYDATASAYIWSAVIDSDIIPDGDVDLHYIIYDKADNAFHTEMVDGLEIANEAPQIDSISLATDVNGDGDMLDAQESGTYGTAGAFMVRNNAFYVAPSFIAGTGNGSLTYEVYYAGDTGETKNLVGTTSATLDAADFGSTGVLVPDGDSIIFVVRITDEEGLFDQQNITVKVKNNDTIKPTAEMNLPDVSDVPTQVVGLETELLGRLQPAGDSSYDGEDADLSGSFTFSGSASDEQRIDEIRVAIDGYDGGNGLGAAFAILSWTGNDGSGDPDVADVPGFLTRNPHWDSRGVLGSFDDNVTVTTHTLSEADGHDVNWTYTWDSSGLGTVTADDVTITVSAVDFGPNTSDTAAQDPTEASTPLGDQVFNQLDMDVMPFVSNIQFYRGVDLYDSIRSKYGSWTLPEGSDIVLEGFNLDPDWVGLVKTGGTAGVGGDSDAFTAVTPGAGFATVSATMSGNHSGWLQLSVNGAPGTGQPLMNHNNVNNATTHPQNSEATSNYPDWFDDRYVEVWNVDNAVGGTSGSYYGSLTVDNDGVPMSTWINYSGAETLYSGSQIFYKFDPPEFSDIQADQNGNPYVVYLANFKGSGYNGALALWGNNASATDPSGWFGSRFDGYNLEEVDSMATDDLIWQFLNPSIYVHDNNGTTATIDNDIYISYYDDNSNALKFGHFVDTGGEIYNRTANTTNTNTDSEYFTDAGWGDDRNIIAGTASIADDGGTPGDDTDDDVGYWSDVAVDQFGAPVVVYQDTKNKTLRLLRANSTDPINTSGWMASQLVLPEDSSVGEYVSMSIDSDGDVHIIAFKSTTAELVYIHAENRGAGVMYAFDDPVVVDSVGNKGQWCDLALLNNEPVAAYLDSSLTGTNSGVIVARKDSLAGTWEFSTPPLASPVKSGERYRLSIEGLPSGATVTDPTDYEVLVGFSSSDYRYVRLRPEK